MSSAFLGEAASLFLRSLRSLQPRLHVDWDRAALNASRRELESDRPEPYSRSFPTLLEVIVYRKSALVTLSLSLALVTGCKSPEQKAAEDATKNLQEASNKMAEAAKNGGTPNMGDAMNALGAAMGSANGGKKVETVDFHVLKDMLPGDLSGMKRTEATGEKNAAMGINIANAEGRYSNNAGASMNVKITDIGSMTGLAGMAMYAWATTEIDKETDTGYEKTSTFNGYKSHEKYDKSGKSGELTVIVGGRFVVEVQGNDVDMNAIKDAMNKIDLKKLDSMKGQGVQ